MAGFSESEDGLLSQLMGACRKKRWKCLLAIVWAWAPSAAMAALEGPSPPALEGTPLFAPEDCAVIACRAPGGNFVIRTSDGSDFSFPIWPWPYVTKDGTIIIFPGESITVNFPNLAETPGLPHYLDAPAETEKINTLTVSYKYENVGGKVSSFLTLRQTSKKLMKLDAHISVFVRGGGLQFQASSTCPLQPEMSGLETWPYELGPILLHNIRFLAEDAPQGCP